MTLVKVPGRVSACREPQSRRSVDKGQNRGLSGRLLSNYSPIEKLGGHRRQLIGLIGRIDSD